MALLKGLSGDPLKKQLQKLSSDPEGAAEVAVELLELLADGDEEVRQWASECLENLECPRSADAKTFGKLATSETEDCAFWSLKMLGRLGEQARTEEERIAKALAKSHPIAVRQNAAWALSKLGTISAATRSQLEAAAMESDARLVQLSKQALSQA